MECNLQADWVKRRHSKFGRLRQEWVFCWTRESQSREKHWDVLLSSAIL